MNPDKIAGDIINFNEGWGAWIRDGVKLITQIRQCPGCYESIQNNVTECPQCGTLSGGITRQKIIEVM